MTGTYPLGMLTVFDGGLALDCAVGRVEFSRGRIDEIDLKGPGLVHVVGNDRNLQLRLRSPEAVAALLSLR